MQQTPPFNPTNGHPQPFAPQAPAGQQAFAATPAPFAPQRNEAIRTQAPAQFTPQQARPVSQAPIAQAPIAQAPIAQAPVAQAPVSQAPQAHAPVQAQVATPQPFPAQATTQRTAAIAVRSQQFPVQESAGGVKLMGLPNPVGEAVQASQFVAPKTGLYSMLGYFVAIPSLLLSVIFTFGMILFTPLIEMFTRKIIYTRIKGSCLQVTPDQLPEIYQAASTMAQRLGMTSLPEIFVQETNSMNAVAAALGGRKLIILSDDVVDGCMRTGDLSTLNFVLGHELGHHALGHTGMLRSMIRMFIPKLSRLDEFSADAVANALVGNAQSSASALILLLTGPQLLPYVSREAVFAQAMNVSSSKFWLKQAEGKSHHPMMLRRIARVLNPSSVS